MPVLLQTKSTLQLDDYFLQGNFDNTQPIDPPGAISLGLTYLPYSGPNSLVDSPELRDLAVLSRIYENTGTVLDNEGIAGDGTKLAGTWSTDESGRIYIADAAFSYAHHASMVGVIDPTDEPQSNVGCAMIIKNWTTGIIVDKPSFFTLAMDAYILTFKQTIVTGETTGKKGVVGASENLSVLTPLDPLILPVDQWYVLGVTIVGTSLNVYINGRQVRSHIFRRKIKADPGNTLYVGRDAGNTSPADADIDLFLYSGTGAAVSFMNRLNPPSGSWKSPVIDLGSSKYFAGCKHPDSWLNLQHRATLELVLSDTPSFKVVDLVTIDLGEKYEEFPDRTFYWPQIAKGRYLRATINLSQNEATFAPYLDNVQLFFHS